MSGSIGFREPSYLSNKRFYAITLCVELCGISVGLKHGECYEKKLKSPIWRHLQNLAFQHLIQINLEALSFVDNNETKISTT